VPPFDNSAGGLAALERAAAPQMRVFAAFRAHRPPFLPTFRWHSLCNRSEGEKDFRRGTAMTTRKTALVLVLIGTAACACSRPVVAPFSELDADKDGRISIEEAEKDAVLNEIFSDFDSDQNGELSVLEYLQAIKNS
jgi:hypothetical protein